MEKKSSFIELAYSSIPIFANDGTVDMEELNFLLGLALQDDQIDDDERRVLKSIFDRVKNASPKVMERIAAVREKYSI